MVGKQAGRIVEKVAEVWGEMVKGARVPVPLSCPSVCLSQVGDTCGMVAGSV